MVLKVRRLRADAALPRYAHPGDAGLDLCACERVELPPGAACLVKTGIAVELPEGTEAQVRPRSGLALRNGITVLNSPGTIDRGYRGEVGVILINHGPEPFIVDKGMRIAQIVVAPVLTVEVHEVRDMEESERGAGGFGSTGSGNREDT